MKKFSWEFNIQYSSIQGGKCVGNLRALDWWDCLNNAISTGGWLVSVKYSVTLEDFSTSVQSETKNVFCDDTTSVAVRIFMLKQSKQSGFYLHFNISI